MDTQILQPDPPHPPPTLQWNSVIFFFESPWRWNTTVCWGLHVRENTIGVVARGYDVSLSLQLSELALQYCTSLFSRPHRKLYHGVNPRGMDKVL